VSRRWVLWIPAAFIAAGLALQDCGWTMEAGACIAFGEVLLLVFGGQLWLDG
jgi:hypothetical protein